MRALVTGCAGFIGSSLTEHLIDQGYEVTGIDCFSDYYSPEIKRSNLVVALGSQRFRFIQGDILEMDDFPEVDFVFHQAAQAGVRASWGKNFNVYLRNNVDATQRLLEHYKGQNLKKFVFASSSSVYGNARTPMAEDELPRPLSPYGVTKLAGENLCYLYWKAYRLPIISLRYFTVFGPRQRPDMFIYKLIRACMSGQKTTVYGDGDQTRDFSYIDDVVDANLRAATSDIAGETFNIGTGGRITINSLIGKVEELTGESLTVERIPAQKGDVESTCADITRARDVLGWKPGVSLDTGLRNEIRWMKNFRH